MAHTISLDLDLRFLHFLEQLRVADDPSSISDLATRFVEACDDTHDGTLRDVSELRDLFEWLSDGSQRAHILICVPYCLPCLSPTRTRLRQVQA